ncbi:hypothetical protein GCM10017044_18590 [Kordiimonas sediminis]|uniref:Uncharacterized protein n=1 Tax=Kordiimonas sediminis TaxID=1735581 RepID=A0A919AUE1_9PROT|nr:hypothetical protein GCM10017044_18590 [Kordiimonas sediminis]
MITPVSGICRDYTGYNGTEGDASNAREDNGFGRKYVLFTIAIKLDMVREVAGQLV